MKWVFIVSSTPHWPLHCPVSRHNPFQSAHFLPSEIKQVPEPGSDLCLLYSPLTRPHSLNLTLKFIDIEHFLFS